MWKNDIKKNDKIDRNKRNFQLLMVTNVLAEVDVVLMGLEFI